jgi:GYF domain 2
VAGGEEAIWHVMVDDARQGPLSKAQVLEFLRDGTRTGSDLIWCPGFPDWKPVSEINDFWQPPPRTSARVEVPVQLQTQVKALPERLDEPLRTDRRGKKWSLWKSANIGLLISAFVPLAQVGGGRGFELANYAHTASVETISALLGQILGVPILFVLVAIVRNLYARPARSSASPVPGTIKFATLIVGIFAALIVYGEVLFSSCVYRKPHPH